MKAIVRDKYGSPDILELREIDRPVPKENQVLVKIHAASANALDWHILRAKPFVVRLMGFGFLTPKRKILGADIAGVVEAVGKDVTRFKAGDEVFGSAMGGFAEYACYPEKWLASKPTNVSFVQAAAVPVAGLTALQGLRDKGEIKPGHSVLVNGASGGVGTFAVQIAKALGAEVTGVCSGRNVDMVRSLGADHVIDYTQEDYSESGRKYDLILDAAAFGSLRKTVSALTPTGTCVVVGGATSIFVRQPIVNLVYGRKGGRQIKSILTNVNQKDLDYLRELLETGKIVPAIGRTYPLAEVPDAIRYMEAGHTQGKVVIEVC